MITTKTQVERAIMDAERISPADMYHAATITIMYDTLLVLIEAAKCARYRNIHSTRVDAPSNSELILDDEPYTPVAAPVEDDEIRALSDGGPADNE